MSEKLDQRLKAFAYHAPSPPVQAEMAAFRQAFMALATQMDRVLPASGDAARYTALAFTELEKVSMWTMKALSHADPEGKQVSP